MLTASVDKQLDRGDTDTGVSSSVIYCVFFFVFSKFTFVVIITERHSKETFEVVSHD